MILAVTLAFAADCDVAGALTTLRTTSDEAAYHCVIDASGAHDALAQAVRSDRTNPRLTRALGLWLLQNVPGEFTTADVQLLTADDRRLLSDGVRARRGRASPAPEHAKVFQQFSWYHPVLGWTDARLDATDRANIQLADDPPPVVPETAPTPAATPPAPVSGCGGGCAAFFFFPLSLRRRHARRQRAL